MSNDKKYQKLTPNTSGSVSTKQAHKKNSLSIPPLVRSIRHLGDLDLRTRIGLSCKADPSLAEMFESYKKLEIQRRRTFAIANLDQKSPVKDPCVESPEQAALKQKLRMLMGVSGLGKTGYKGRFTGALITITSAASSPVDTVTALYPNTSDDCKILSGIFDECRTTHLEVFVRFQCLTSANAPSGPITSAPDAMVVFDPANAGVYGGVTGGLDALHRIGPCSVRAGVSPSAYSGKGIVNEFHHAVWKIPEPIVDPGLVTDLLGSNWVSSLDTSVLIGYLKPYINSMGTSGYGNMLVYPVYHQEFRVRG